MDESRWERRLKEKGARQEAERLLEEKSIVFTEPTND